MPARVVASQLFIVTTSARAKIVSHASTGTWATAGDTETTSVTKGGRAAAHSLSSAAACAFVMSEAATWTRSPSRSSMQSRARARRLRLDAGGDDRPHRAVLDDQLNDDADVTDQFGGQDLDARLDQLLAQRRRSSGPCPGATRPQSERPWPPPRTGS